MNKHALCIGINDYPGTGSDLAGCVNDANDWAAAFADRGFTVKKLLDRQATGKAIRGAIASIVTGARRGDSIVVQFSGHGSFVPDLDGDEPDGTDECLCPYDLKEKGPITDDDLFELFSAQREGVRIVMISDSCHSGTVARFAPISTPPPRRTGIRPGGRYASCRRPFFSPGMRRCSGYGGRNGFEPPRTVRRSSSCGMPGHGVQLRCVLRGTPQRRVHVRRLAVSRDSFEGGNVRRLVPGDPPRPPIPSIPPDAQPVRGREHEEVEGSVLSRRFDPARMACYG